MRAPPLQPVNSLPSGSTHTQFTSAPTEISESSTQSLEKMVKSVPFETEFEYTGCSILEISVYTGKRLLTVTMTYSAVRDRKSASQDLSSSRV